MHNQDYPPILDPNNRVDEWSVGGEFGGRPVGGRWEVGALPERFSTTGNKVVAPSSKSKTRNHTRHDISLSFKLQQLARALPTLRSTPLP